MAARSTASISIDERHPTATFAVNAKLVSADANKLMSAVANSNDTLYGTIVCEHQPDLLRHRHPAMLCKR